MKIGDKVRNTKSGSVGEVALVKVPGLPDCALVRFNPISDGYCIPRSQLVIVEETK